MSTQEPLVLAVDGGQSSTLALIATYTGRILGAGWGGPSNHIHEPGGPERLHNALHDSIGEALRNAGADAGNITHACLGMTGGAQQSIPIVQSIAPNSAIQVYQDVVTALAGASVAQPGVIVIAGTGSVAYGKLADGRSALAGGWGYIMGDEGSAYQIGLAALGAASRASDKRGPSTTLLERIPAWLERSTLREVHKGIYSAAITRPQIAGLAAAVGAAAREDSDGVAQDTLSNAGHDLAEAALAVIEALEMSEAGMSVYTTGGVFHAGEFILDPFRARIAARSSASAVNEAAYSPVIGALFLALQAAGTELTPDVIQAIHDSAPKAAISKHLSQNG